MLEKIFKAIRRPRQGRPAVVGQPCSHRPALQSVIGQPYSHRPALLDSLLSSSFFSGCIKRTKADEEEVVGRLKPKNLQNFI